MNKSNITENQQIGIEKSLKILSINAVSKKLGIGYTKTKKLVDKGYIKSVDINGKFGVPEFRINEFLHSDNPLVNNSNNLQVYEEDEVEAQSIFTNLKS